MKAQTNFFVMQEFPQLFHNPCFEHEELSNDLSSQPIIKKARILKIKKKKKKLYQFVLTYDLLKSHYNLTGINLYQVSVKKKTYIGLLFLKSRCGWA